jgi:hypothetical protein
MNAEIQYTVMGDDGHEYGPVAPSQIRQWVEEGRLEKKTPVRPTGAKDWMFLGDVSEFAALFAPPPHPSESALLRKGLIVVLLLIGLAAGLYYFFRHLNPH